MTKKGEAKKKSPKENLFVSLGKKVFLLLRILVHGTVWSGVGLLAILLVYGYDLPFMGDEVLVRRRPSITLLDRNHQLLCTLGDRAGPVISPSELPLLVKQAFIATEDRRFYKHKGLDLWGVIRAFWVNSRSGNVLQGGSTLTQQLAKNFLQASKLYTYRDRSFRRKIQEVLLAFWLEYKFTKDQILTLYLNRVYFGGGIFGLSGAAHRYFHQPVSSLTVAQAAVLAGLVKAPSAYCPLQSPQRALDRARVVLSLMEKEGFLTPAARRQAQASLTPALFTCRGKDLSIPPSVGYFSDWVMESLSQTIGAVEEDMIVVTTLEGTLQRKTQEALESVLKKEPSSAIQGAVVILTPEGAIRSMVGGREYGRSQFNRATQALRQPGSTFKLFVYLAALEKGYTPWDFLEDTPLQGKWKPKNYGWVSQGEITLEEAFVHSVNTATVRLAQKIGIKAIQHMAYRLGISRPLPQDLSLSLGTGEVTLLELTTAYGSVQKGGKSLWPYGIEKVLLQEGKKVLYEHQASPPVQLVDPQSISLMKEMLYQVVQRGTGRDLHPLSSYWGGKTGTTQDHQDALFVGYSDKLICGVWMGQDNNQSLGRMTGSQGPLQVCRRLLHG